MEMKLENKQGNEISNLSLKTFQSENPSENLISDAIPEDLLFALTAINETPQDQTLRPVKRLKTPKELRLAIKKGPPDSAWHHKGRRIQFKHLTDFPRGNGKNFGTRDVSFLYDVAGEEKSKPTKPNTFDKTALRYDELTKMKSMGSQLAVPETIIPEEYHMVKSNAVMGLEQIDSELTSSLVDKEKTLRIFPSLKPTKRFEVVQLSKTLDMMLERVGVNDLQSEVKGPTQIHNLLELIKKEQQIYDTIFHEVIRQVTVECSDRGKLLSKLRQRYADLISRIPQQIESLHSEVMAQRSLDRRLTEELLRFKQSIGQLTSELSTVKEHDKHITKQAEEAQLDLSEALKESHTNASLVNEYHELYELQRHRLEQQIINLTEERELWSNAAYSLCLKVMQNNSLTTAKRLHVTKKAWAKLAGHLAVLLSDRDTEDLVSLQKHVDKWREQIFHLHQVLESEDKTTTNVLDHALEMITKLLQLFKDKLLTVNPINEVRSMKSPRNDQMENILTTLKEWEEMISGNTDRFGGDNLLLNQERISEMRAEVEAWTDISLAVYNRHRSFEGERNPQQDIMLSNNNIISKLYKQLSVRIMGENGLAKGLISLQTIIENWISRITLSLKGADVLSDGDWLRFYDDFGDVLTNIVEIKSRVGLQQKEEDFNNNLRHEHIHIQDTILLVQTWLKDTVNGIDGEDGKLSVQVSKIHSDMTHWVVLVLLHLAPDVEQQGLTTESSIGMTCTLDQLTDQCKDLAENVSVLTNYLSQCVSSVVEASMQAKREFDEADADHEYRDFLRFKVECKEWIHTCELLVNTLHEEPVKILSNSILIRLNDNKNKQVKSHADEPPKKKETKQINEKAATKSTPDEKLEDKKEDETKVEAPVDEKVTDVAHAEATTTAEGHEVNEQTPSTETPDVTEDGETKKAATPPPENMEIIGADENVTSARLLQDKEASADDLSPPSSALTKSAFDAIARMDELQEQLLETEERAQKAESVSLDLRDELNVAQERIRAMEKRIAEMSNESTPEENKETTSSSPTLTVDSKEKTSKPSSPSEQTRKTSSRGSPSGKRSKPKKK